MTSVSHNTSGLKKKEEGGRKKKRLQVAQVLNFVSALKSRLGAREAGEGEINWLV